MQKFLCRNQYGREVYEDHTGATRVMGCTPISAQARTYRYTRQSFTGWLAAQGLPLIPRTEWKPIDRRGQFGPEFINNQKSCSGCVGWSGGAANTKLRVLRGLSFQKLSGAFVYAHINGGRDGGASITDAMRALEQFGTCLESEFDYPQIYTRQIPASAIETAKRFMLKQAVTIDTFDEIGTALQMGFIPQFPINVGGNFEQFDRDGVAGASRGGNHSVHADGIKQSSSGAWILDMPNSWGTSWGPLSNGRCYLSEAAIKGAAGGSDAYVHIDELVDPQDPNNPPTPVN